MKHNFIKGLTLLLALLMSISLVACGGGDDPVDPNVPDNPVSDNKSEFNDEIYARDMLKAFEVLKSCDEELFTAEVDFDTKYIAAYKNGKPAIIIGANDEIPSTYEEDPAAAYYYLVKNYKSMAELKAALAHYFSDEVIATLNISDNLSEVDGALYLVRGGRGYGGILPDLDTVLLKSETALDDGDEKKYSIEYYAFGSYEKTREVTFKWTKDHYWQVVKINVAN